MSANESKGAKREVLFVTEKWSDCNPQRGATNSVHNLFGSLQTSGLAEQRRFHFDAYYHQNKKACDATLLSLCVESRPDLLFYTWCGNYYSPKPETLYLIKKISIPIVAMWWEVMAQPDLTLPFVDLNVVVHSACLQKVRHPKKYLLMWTPQDPRVYYDPNINRDIEVSFTGSMNSPHYAHRRSGIAALNSKGIDVYLSGGQQGERRLSVDGYARIYMRSKIALNFSLGPGGIQHAKGRIFEATLCGAMLLDSENLETAMWFEPMVDYVPFTDETDLVEKARYYLEHDSEREEIASKGYQKAKEVYTAERFWRAIFDRVFGSSSPPYR